MQAGTPQPWHAEREVSTELAAALIREQFPGLGARIEPFGSGWDNTAYLVDGDIVFRFPRKQSTVELLEAETRAMPRLGPRLPLAVPVPEWVGRATEAYPWPFAGYRRLAGRTADAAELSEDERRAAAPVLARFLAALHASDPAGLGLPGDTIHRTSFDTRMGMLVERLRHLRESGVVDDPSPWLRLFEAGDFPAPASNSRVVHGDLYARHLLVGEDRRIRGVIDWGDVHLGDPGIDLKVMYGFFPPSARDDFRRAYGEIDARTQRMARLRAAFHAVALAWFAHSTGEAGLLRESLLAMRNSLVE